MSRREGEKESISRGKGKNNIAVVNGSDNFRCTSVGSPQLQPKVNLKKEGVCPLTACVFGAQGGCPALPLKEQGKRA